MGLEIVGGLEEGLVGGDDRQLRLIGKVEQHRLDRPLLGQTVPLHLDIEAVAEDAFQRREAGAGKVRVGLGEREVDHAFGPAGERDEAVGMGGKSADAGQDFAGLRRREISVAGEAHQIGIAALVLGEHGDAAVSLRPFHLRSLAWPLPPRPRSSRKACSRRWVGSAPRRRPRRTQGRRTDCWSR